MKTFPPGLDGLLATGQYVFADLYVFTLQDGTVLYYTTADTDVSYGGNIYTSKGPFFDQISSSSRAHWKAGVDLDTWTIQITPATENPVTRAAFPAQIYGKPWLEQVRVGAFDAAVVDIHRAYWASWPLRPFTGAMVPSYVLIDLFAGRVAAIDVSRTGAVITINSWVELLQRQMPRNIFSSGCRWTLFDSGCQLVRATYQLSGSVTSITDDQVFQISIAVANDYFSLGMLTWTSGNNAPYSRSISTYEGSTRIIRLRSAMPYAIQFGDTFNIWPGCDKTMDACQNKFANLINFGGFPFIPAPENSV